MKTLSVPDMHCPKCVERIKNALAAEKIECEVDLSAKTVSVNEADAAKAIEALDDIGFEAK